MIFVPTKFVDKFAKKIDRSTDKFGFLGHSNKPWFAKIFFCLFQPNKTTGIVGACNTHNQPTQLSQPDPHNQTLTTKGVVLWSRGYFYHAIFFHPLIFHSYVTSVPVKNYKVTKMSVNIHSFALLLVRCKEPPMHNRHCRLLIDTMKSLSPAARTLKPLRRPSNRWSH